MSVISVVTVLHDSAAHVAALLDSLRRHRVERRSSRSTPARPTTARRWPRAARRRRWSTLGATRASARPTTPASSARGTTVTVLLNPDCELLDDALRRLAALAAPARRPARARACSTPTARVQRSAHPLPGTRRRAAPGAGATRRVLPRALRERVEPWRSSARGRSGWAIAACVAARTATLRELGPFDPAQFLFYEDLDLCLRARAAGVPTVLAPGDRGPARRRPRHRAAPTAASRTRCSRARRREVVRRERSAAAALAPRRARAGADLRARARWPADRGRASSARAQRCRME